MHAVHAVMQLREQYLKNEPMHTRSETYAAINKSIKTLNDPFTRLLEPSRYQALKRGNQGSVIGVGLEVGFGEGPDSQLVVQTLRLLACMRAFLLCFCIRPLQALGHFIGCCSCS